MVFALRKQTSPIFLSAVFLLCFPICNHATLLTHIIHGRLFDIDPSSLFARELKLIHLKKQRSNNLRNCFFSPVQCLLPFDDGRSVESDAKRRS
ncbi:hypothetical protein QQG55_47780 [Brugia pahangi]